MSAILRKADIGAISRNRSATDPKQTFAIGNFASISARTNARSDDCIWSAKGHGIQFNVRFGLDK